MSARQIRQPLATAKILSTQREQNLTWPHGTNATPSLASIRHTSQKMRLNVLVRTTLVDRTLYFTTELFLTRTVIVARRRSGALSKVYQWLGPRCRHKMTLKHFANHSPNFYTGCQNVENFAFQTLWFRIDARLSLVFCKLVSIQ